MDTLYKARFEALNKKQREAVDATEGPLLVIAGPGTGKTELLAVRTAHIVYQGLALPHEILLLTFTENAALTMRERLVLLMGESAYRVHIHTFHSFCTHVINRYGEYFFEGASYEPLDELRQVEIIEYIVRSLPHKHPFGAYHPERGYIYLRDLIARINHVKSSGFTKDEWRSLTETLVQEAVEIDKIIQTYWPKGRLSIKTLCDLDEVVAQLQKQGSTSSLALAATLRQAVNNAEEINLTEPVSSWKKTHLAVTDSGELITKDTRDREKLLAFSEFYENYVDELHRRWLFDFDDMILTVREALKNHADLRAELEESFRYIMVDEFQDTNDAQLSLVVSLTSSAMHEGRPNICAVGDDDQAIYKFQGALTSTMLHFKERLYKEVKLIVLTDNYRSTSDILELSRRVVVKGVDRLEKSVKELNKTLSQSNRSLKPGAITLTHTETQEEECAALVAHLQVSQKENDTIAIIARNHRELVALLPHLDTAQITYSYSRKDNVFDDPHICELIDYTQYITSLTSKSENKDFLLPKLLALPYNNIDGEDIIKLSLYAKAHGFTWTEALTSIDNEKLKTFATKMYLLVEETANLPLEQALHKLMEISGFKDYHFGAKARSEDGYHYLQFLESLHVFIESLREYRDGQILTLSHVESFVEMYKSHGLTLSRKSPASTKAKVSLLTAHGAKGLEFDTVYLLATNDSIWTKNKRTNLVPLPLAVKPLVAPVGDNEDDFIKLLYVALTRAKRSIHIFTSDAPLRYILDLQLPVLEPLHSKENALRLITGETNSTPLPKNVLSLLEPFVKDYVMPVTHVQNFLNLPEGGPEYFLMQNLLRFPQPMNESSVFGSAIHKGIELLVREKINKKELPSLENSLSAFKRVLDRARLDELSYKKLLTRGEKTLGTFYAKHARTFESSDLVEVDFKHEGVMVGNARITGKIDYLKTTSDGYQVVDFKTGSSYTSFDEVGLQDYEKIKLHFYKLQLLFYHILLSESSSYRKTPVHKLSLYFVEDNVELELVPTDKDLKEARKLFEGVYTLITSLGFPDTQDFEKNYRGILMFEESISKIS